MGCARVRGRTWSRAVRLRAPAMDRGATIPLHPVDFMRTTRSVGLLALLSIAAVTSGEAQIEARYSKTELRIPMRDGTQLFTVVYAPRDTSRRYPIMMTRTPYS